MVLKPDVLADAIDDVTGIATSYPNQPPQTRAVALFDPATPSISLDVLGRCNREDSCETPPTGAVGGGVTARLHLLNGPLINRKITNEKSTLRQSIDRGDSPDKIVESFYRRALSRPPTDRERAFWSKQLAAKSDQARRERLEDFLWSLLNCREFMNGF